MRFIKLTLLAGFSAMTLSGCQVAKPQGKSRPFHSKPPIKPQSLRVKQSTRRVNLLERQFIKQASSRGSLFITQVKASIKRANSLENR